MDNGNVGIGGNEQRRAIFTPEAQGVNSGEMRTGQVEERVERDRSEAERGTELGTVENIGGGPMIAGGTPGLATMPPVVEDAEGKTIEERNPEVAVDGHKIEQKWVERTEEVIKETKGDPREKEVQVNELKADYLAKRFNRRLGDRN